METFDKDKMFIWHLFVQQPSLIGREELHGFSFSWKLLPEQPEGEEGLAGVCTVRLQRSYAMLTVSARTNVIL